MTTTLWESDVMQRRSKVTSESVNCFNNRGFILYDPLVISSVRRSVSTRSPATLTVETNTTRWFLLCMSSTEPRFLILTALDSHVIWTQETRQVCSGSFAAFFRQQANSGRFPAVWALLASALPAASLSGFWVFCLHQLDVDFSSFKE